MSLKLNFNLPMISFGNTSYCDSTEYINNEVVIKTTDKNWVGVGVENVDAVEVLKRRHCQDKKVQRHVRFICNGKRMAARRWQLGQLCPNLSLKVAISQA